ncbi:hypothetical protein ACFY2M_39145 [Streptomyces sp. NPDC001276]
MPWKLIGGRVDVRCAATLVQLFHEGELVKATQHLSRASAPTTTTTRP